MRLHTFILLFLFFIQIVGFTSCFNAIFYFCTHSFTKRMLACGSPLFSFSGFFSFCLVARVWIVGYRGWVNGERQTGLYALPWLWPVQIVEWPQWCCPSACSWNPISLLRYGACFNRPPPTSLLQTVDHSSNKTWFVFTWWPRVGWFFSWQEEVAHLFNHIKLFLLPAPRLDGDGNAEKKKKSSVLSGKERNFKYTKTTALNNQWKWISGR